MYVLIFWDSFHLNQCIIIVVDDDDDDVIIIIIIIIFINKNKKTASTCPNLASPSASTPSTPLQVWLLFSARFFPLHFTPRS